MAQVTTAGAGIHGTDLILVGAIIITDTVTIGTTHIINTPTTVAEEEPPTEIIIIPIIRTTAVEGIRLIIMEPAPEATRREL